MNAFTVYRSQFPVGAPVKLAIVRAPTIGAARREAKRRWPKWPLVVSRIRSASSMAYRAFCAKKRAARPSQTLT